MKHSVSISTAARVKAASTGAAVEDLVLQEQVRLLYASLTMSQCVALIVGLLLAVGQLLVIEPSRVISWLTCLALVTSARIGLGLQFARMSSSVIDVGAWRAYFIAGAIVSGLTWGSAALLLYPQQSVPHQVFILFTLGGMVAGSATLLTPVYRVFMLFALCTLLPVVARLWFDGDSIHYAMAGMGAMYLLAMLVIGKRISDTVGDSLRLRFENLDLIAYLTNVREQLESKNSKLLETQRAHESAQAALRHHDARFRAISDASPLGIVVFDPHGDCTYSNTAYHRVSGRSFEDTLGRRWFESIHREDRKRVSSAWYRAVRQGIVFEGECRLVRPNGDVVWVRVNAAPMGDNENVLGYVNTVEDVTERKALNEALYLEKERAEVTLHSIGDAVLTTDIEGKVAYLNPLAEKLTGWSHQEAVGKPFSEVLRLVDSTTREPGKDPLQQACQEDRPIELPPNTMLIRRDGSALRIEDSAAPIHDRTGKVTGGVMVFHDATERAMATKMTYLAEHDLLTGLPNRFLLNDRLTQAIGLARRHEHKLALLFLDLDHFKHVNDSLGHSMGDKLLQAVATRLSACVRTSDTVSRQGGDEFLVLLTEIHAIQDAARFAEKISEALAKPHPISGSELRVGASIGISIYPDDGDTVDKLLNHADMAMYYGKEHGRSNYHFFTPEMSTRVTESVYIESRLYRALERGEFVLHYQPKVDLSTGLMAGTEALIRWMDPEYGLIAPAGFISIAERCGLIVPIGQWVLREACTQAKRWNDAGSWGALPVAINVSALQFRHPDFLKSFFQILAETRVDASCIELELTESVFLHDSEGALTTLRTLKRRGVKLAIDDFGTGYSSLSYFRKFPIDTLKIDRAFVQGITDDADDATIATAIISMGRSLNKKVIAEGVETSGQLAFLRAHHCHEGQGFYFSKPMAANDVAAFCEAEHLQTH
ncbi:MAG: EAL domain-containing protein [Pseudomonadota bacterium]